MKRKLLTTDEILRHSAKPASRALVRRKYLKWREAQGTPLRCVMEGCIFHVQPLQWRDEKLGLILDHRNGNKFDNRAKNLRLLCPNCNSQLDTHGGKNRGRVVENAEGKYTLKSGEGRLQYHLLPETARVSITGHAPTIRVGPPLAAKD